MQRLVFCLALVLSSTPLFAQSGLIISEYIEGSSNNKAIEIYNGTGADLNLSGYSVQMAFNGNPTFTLNINLTGTVAADDVFVLAHSSASAVILAEADQTNGAGWFNGDDAIVLRRGVEIIDSIGQAGFDPGSQWGAGLVSTADNTLRRKAGITTGDANPSDVFDPSLEWDGFATDTFDGLGFHGSVPPPPPPPPTTAEIYDIQGSGNASPFAGQVVTTLDNIVTAVAPNGFFLQTPDYRADAATATSNGIFVFTGSAPSVSIGDQVDVTGNVVEFFEMTEFSGNVSVSVDGSNQPLPAYVDLVAGDADFERLEGMLVRLTNGRAADGTDNFNETMVVAGSARPFRAAGIDGGNHPYILDIDPTGLGGAPRHIVGGAQIALAEGPLMFEFGDYSIWTTNLDFTNPDYPRPLRARAPGEMIVAAQNLLRLFSATDARLAAMSAHIRQNLGAPDVLAVSEVGDLQALRALADRINFDEAGLNYVAYLEEGHDIGGIDVGFLVRDTVRVDSVAQLGADDTWIDPSTNAPDPLNDRPPFLLQGHYIANGEPFPIAVIAVHQRSLIGVETSERTRTKRRLQAEALAGYVQELQAAAPGLRLVVTGDFNAFEFDDGYVDTMGILIGATGLANEVLTVPANDRYSYIHEGAAQVLDHALTSSALTSWTRGAQFAHANADAPAAFSPVSDHDAVAVFIMTDYDADGVPDDLDQCSTGDARATVVVSGCDSGVPNLMFEGGCTLADRLAAIRANARNHGAFVSESSALLNDLVKQGLITGAQKGAVQSCIARAN